MTPAPGRSRSSFEKNQNVPKQVTNVGRGKVFHIHPNYPINVQLLFRTALFLRTLTILENCNMSTDEETKPEISPEDVAKADQFKEQANAFFKSKAPVCCLG